METEKLKQEQAKYEEQRKDEKKIVMQNPMKLLKTRNALCRRCASMVANNIHKGTPFELENKDNYCKYCQKKLEAIWKQN